MRKKKKRQAKRRRMRRRTNWNDLVTHVLSANKLPRAVLEEALPPVRSADLLPKVEWP